MAQALQRLLLSPADYNRIEGLINQERAQQGLPPLISYPVIPPDEAETAFALIEEEAKSSGPLARTAGLFLRLLAWAASVFPAAVGDDDGDATMGVDVLLESETIELYYDTYSMLTHKGAPWQPVIYPHVRESIEGS